MSLILVVVLIDAYTVSPEEHRPIGQQNAPQHFGQVGGDHDRMPIAFDLLVSRGSAPDIRHCFVRRVGYDSSSEVANKRIEFSTRLEDEVSEHIAFGKLFVRVALLRI